MKHVRYDPQHAKEILPLLESIGREITERSLALAHLETEITTLESEDPVDDDRMHGLVAEASAHRRGLRLAKAELERLGCSVVGTTPLTFRIPGRIGTRDRSFVWRTGDLALT